MSDEPLVSCMCVSKPDRWGLLQRAILNFHEQTYTNKELVIIANDASYVDGIRSWMYMQLPHDVKIRVYKRTVRVGCEGVVHAMAMAYGEYLAIWDDDNQNHEDRLTAQMRRQLTVPEAMTMLEDSLYYFHDSNEVFFVNYQNPTAKPDERGAISTLMGRRELWPEVTYSNREQPLVDMVRKLGESRVRLATVPGLPFHHIVGVRGDNGRGYESHRQLATAAPNSRKRDWVMDRKDKIDELLAFHYRWDTLKLTISGSDAIACETAVNRPWPDDLYPVGEPNDKVERVTELIPQ